MSGSISLEEIPVKMGSGGEDFEPKWMVAKSGHIHLHKKKPSLTSGGGCGTCLCNADIASHVDGDSTVITVITTITMRVPNEKAEKYVTSLEKSRNKVKF